MIEASKSKSNLKKAVSIIGLAICFLILLVSLPLSLLWALVKGSTTFFPQKVYSQKSPDGRLQIDVSRKVYFPVLDIDPEIKVYLSLKNTENNHEFSSLQFNIREFSDLEEPDIVWIPNGVRIENIDTNKQFSFDLRLPNYLVQE